MKINALALCVLFHWYVSCPDLPCYVKDVVEVWDT